MEASRGDDFYCLMVQSNYNCKDKYGKSCLDYANEFLWRKGFIELVEELEHDK
ncbi:hypothetical protein [Mobilisporobacter senegalensis]|uniref:hypothetical protein n=1 Tax=Mobilisporobacter senegalensis TaxID=1329262 RepID=UPI001473F2D7|nr:hypothetical protein [Mobilisporobacter senegalensis]